MVPLAFTSTSGVRKIGATGLIVVGIGVLVLGGCSRLREPSFEPTESGSLGVLDDAYDKALWRWVRNVDGRVMLTHTQVPRCFVIAQPDEDYNDPEFTAKREDKMIGGGRYQVINLYEHGEFWEAIYIQSSTNTPLLSVYADGRCRAEAERILETHEKALARRVKD